jgi:hypothetical protein
VLAELVKQYEQTRAQAGAILGNLQGLVQAREAQTAIVNDSEPLRRGLDTLQQQLTGTGGLSSAYMAWPGCWGWHCWCASGYGLLQLFVQDQTTRARAGRIAAPGGRAPGAGGQARQRRQPGRHSAADERAADGGRRAT